MRKIVFLFVVFMLSLCLIGCNEGDSKPTLTPTPTPTPTPSIPSEVSVQSITLSKSEITMQVGDEVSISASILPSNATDKNLTWSSTNTAVPFHYSLLLPNPRVF